MSRPSCKEAILEAAEEIVIETGAAHLTLDAVAECAKVSKGGLMYHFPSKESLLQAMISRLMDRFERLRDRVRQEVPQGQNNELLVEIVSLVKYAKFDERISAALLAVISNMPDLLTPFQDKNRERFNTKVLAGRKFEKAAILLYAALGLHFHELLKFNILTEEQREQIYQELIRQAGGGEGLEA
jgi:AcrR family transcriptional regulator